MATNPFFQNYTHSNTQELLDDLCIEAIRMYGIDTYYVTRSLQAVDDILNEDDLSIFDSAYLMEMYVKNVDSFEGEGDFLSKFGLTIRDQVTMTVAIRTFEKYATRLDPNENRPKEGNLIYFPFNDKFFKIMHVEHESIFYQAGALQVYDIKCELFEFGNERFQTGVEAIDTHYDHIDTTDVTSLEGLHNTDKIAKNIFFETEADDIIDFSEKDPFSETVSYPTDKADSLSYRYWRIEATESVDSAGFGLGEVAFLDGYGAAVSRSSVVASASAEANTSFVASNVLDGDPATAWSTGNVALPHHIAFDFGDITNLSAMVISARTGVLSDDEGPTTFTIQASEDGVNWTVTREYVGEAAWGDGETRTYAIV